jgi:hypothetical protein
MIESSRLVSVRLGRLDGMTTASGVRSATQERTVPSGDGSASTIAVGDSRRNAIEIVRTDSVKLGELLTVWNSVMRSLTVPVTSGSAPTRLAAQMGGRSKASLRQLC